MSLIPVKKYPKTATATITELDRPVGPQGRLTHRLVVDGDYIDLYPSYERADAVAKWLTGMGPPPQEAIL